MALRALVLRHRESRKASKEPQAARAARTELMAGFGP